jgi:hypothetical protein
MGSAVWVRPRVVAAVAAWRLGAAAVFRAAHGRSPASQAEAEEFALGYVAVPLDCGLTICHGTASPDMIRGASREAAAQVAWRAVQRSWRRVQCGLEPRAVPEAGVGAAWLV